MSFFCNSAENTEANTSVLVFEPFHISCLAFHVLSSPSFSPQNFSHKNQTNISCKLWKMPAAKIQSKQLLEKLHPNLSLNRAFFIFLTRTYTWKGFFILISQAGYQMDFCFSVCMLFKSWFSPSVCLGVEQNHDPYKYQCHSVIVSATVTCCPAVFWVSVQHSTCMLQALHHFGVHHQGLICWWVHPLLGREALILDLICTLWGAQKSRVCGMFPHELDATSCSSGHMWCQCS